MIVDNIHKKRGVRSVLCLIGRHDYEAYSVRLDDQNYPRVMLYCFYCGDSKESRAIVKGVV
jgi:hypothetical protein